MTVLVHNIGQSVGQNGLNREDDVKIVQRLLNAAFRREEALRASGLELLSSDGRCGPRTVAAIEHFQRLVLRWSGPAVDGTVNPGKQTWKALNGNVASNHHIAPRAVPRPAQVDGYGAYRQGDFHDVKLGEGDLRISGYGCLLCTLTMAATSVGNPTNHWKPDGLLPHDLTPPLANEIMTRAGAFSGSLLKISIAAKSLGMSCHEYGMRPGAWDDELVANDLSKIEDNLLQDNPVAANVDYKGSAQGDHWILLTRRIGSGLFGGIDPAYGRALTLTKSPPPSGALDKGRDSEGGVLFGWGQGGLGNQPKYVVKRFAVLARASGGFCAAL
jgi:hypothetical protein